MNLFFDIETTGLVKKGLVWEIDFDDFPHIVQIAWKIGEKEREYIIHQEGREIPIEATALHGITTAMGNAEGLKTFEEVMTEFLSEASEAEKIIGFNIYFDSSIVKAGILRKYGHHSEQAALVKAVLDKDKRIDVMRRLQQLREVSGGKWLKLQHAYELLFNENYSAHTALEDVRATERCHHELLKRGL